MRLATSLAMAMSTQIMRPSIVFDAHCHIGLDKSLSEVSSYLTNKRMGICATKIENWDDVMNIKRAFPQVHACIGIHPYYVQNYTGNESLVISNLKTTLALDESLVVGEIGIDKCWVTKETHKNEFEKMMHLFELQFDLASEMNRPVVVHCVKSSGYLHDFLKSRSIQGNPIPPKVILSSLHLSLSRSLSFSRL